MSLTILTPAIGGALGGRDFTATGNTDSSLASAILHDKQNNNPAVAAKSIAQPGTLADPKMWTAEFTIPANYPAPGNYELEVINTDSPATKATVSGLTC